MKSRFFSTAAFWAVVILLQLGLAFAASAQTGSIQGTAVDQQGRAIAGATVQALDQQKGIVARDAVTDSDGTFQLQPLLPGTYTIKLTATGMKELSSTDIVLDQNQTLNLGQLKMSLGGSSESITVESSTPLVETSNADHSSVIDSKLVTETSLNGRDFQSLIRTLPGVVSNDASDFRLAFNNTDSFNVNGQRGSANNVFLDGAVNTDVGANDGQFTQLSLDAVGEFKLQTNNFAAEYGRNAGVLIAINTKSGGQQYHGTLYEFNREDGFDATPFFSGSKTELRFNQFGGNIGGPIILPKVSPRGDKKLFFFYNYEGTRAIKPGSQPYASNAPGTYDLPDPAELMGDFTTSYKFNADGSPQQLGASSFQVGQIFVPGSITRNSSGVITGGTPICGTVGAPCNIVPESMFSNQAPAIVNFVSQAYLPGFFALTGQNSDRVRVPFHDIYRFRKNQNVARVDFNVNAKTNFFFRWVDDSQRESDQGGLFGFSDYPILPQFRKKPGSSWSWNLVNVISPSITNEFIFGYNHLTQVVDIDDTVPKSYFDRTSLGFTFQEPFPQVNLDNRFPSLGPCCQGNFTGAIFDNGWHSEARMFDWTDNVTKVAGVHTIKFGIFFEYNQSGQQPTWTDAPSFNFATGSGNTNDSNNYVANMLLGNYQTASQSNGVFFGAFRFHQVEAYGQDTWKVSHKLTLDLGLRWAYLGPTYTVQPFFQNYFDPSLYNPANAVTINTTGCTDPPACTINDPNLAGSILPGSGDPFNGIVQENHGIPKGFAEHRYNNFMPRVGFAYDPRGNGKTAIRGGFGMFYERIRQNVNSFDALANPPLTYTPTIPNGNIDNFGPGLVTGIRFPVGLNAFDKKGQIPTTYAYSLGVQHELPWQLGLEVAYVGSQSRHLQYQYNLQTFPVGSFLSGAPGGCQTCLGPYLGYTNINFTSYGANSSYNGLQTKLTRRFFRNLTLTADYTWSKTMDLEDGDNNNKSGNAITDPFNLKRDYAVAGYDRTHVFNFNYVYSLPEFKNSSTFVRLAAGGWEVSGITRFWSGTPLDVTISGNAGNFIGVVRPDLTGEPIYLRNERNQTYLNPAAFVRPADGTVGSVGRNSFRGPGINNFDISLFKNFNFRENMRVQLRLETFNIFNHVQATGVRTGFSAPNAGDPANLDGTGNVNGYRDPRQIQLGAKFYF